MLLARGDWHALRELAVETEQLVTTHSGTAFCYAVTTARALAVVAPCVGRAAGRGAEVLLSRAELPLQAEPLERESVLLLAYGAAGARGTTWCGSAGRCASRASPSFGSSSAWKQSC